MESFFKKFFEAISNASGDQFAAAAPPPNTGRAFVQADLLCVRGAPFLNPDIKISALQHIYRIAHWGREEYFLFDGTQHFIPTNLEGIAPALTEVARQLGIEASIFFQKTAPSFAGKAIKTQLWRRAVPDNCRLLPMPDAEAAHLCEEFLRGFWTLTEPPVFVSWDTVFEELARAPYARAAVNHYGNGEIHFPNPVRLGCFEMDDFRFYRPHFRADIPLQDAYAHLQMGGAGAHNYFRAKAALEKILGKSAYFWERDDQNSMTWRADGLEIMLCYSFDSEHGFESGSVLFMVKNQREYPVFLENGDYEARIEISEHLFLPKAFALGADFRRTVFAKNTPRLLREMMAANPAARQSVIWRDDANQKIGFAQGERALIFPKNAVESWRICNIEPAKGPGSASIRAVLDTKTELRAAEGEPYDFDEHWPVLRRLLGENVVREEDYDY